MRAQADEHDDREANVISPRHISEFARTPVVGHMSRALPDIKRKKERQMAACYRCGGGIRTGEGYRREVRTGRSTRVYFSRRGGGSYGESYGLRTLCSGCTNALDQSNASAAKRMPFAAAAAILSAILTIRNIHSFPSDVPSSLAFFFLLLGGPGFIVYWLLGLFINQPRQQQESALTSGDSYPEASGAVFDNETRAEPSFRNPNSSLASAGEEPSGELIKRSFENVVEAVELYGISFAACYGYVRDPDGGLPAALIIRALDNVPPRLYKSAQKWETDLKEDTFNRFSAEVAAATNSQDVNALVFLFPHRDEEDSDEYMGRLSATLKAVEPAEEAENH